MSCSGETTWVASGDRHLAAYVHTPDDQLTVRGVVVIAPPIGKEAVATFRALKALAHRATAAGFVTLRFNWSGEGDSFPFDPDTGPLAAWRQDLDAVLTLAEQLVPDAKPSLVGVRLGACLAGEVDPARLSHRILWEPINGRKYLRYHSALRRVSLDDPVLDTGVELDGSWHSDSDAAQIKTLKSTEDASEVIHEPTPQALSAFVEAESRNTIVPWASIDEILASLPPGEYATAPFTPTSTVSVTSSDGSLSEEFVEAGRLKLPAVLTRPLDRPVSAVMLTFPAGSEPRTGPSALWARAARALACEGLATLRIDRVGQGELMQPDATFAPNPYTAAAADEGASSIAYLRELFPDAKLLLAGLCNGAWVASLSAPAQPVDLVVAFNNIAWKREPAFYRYLDPSLNSCAADPDTTEEAPVPHRTLRSTVRAWQLKVYDTKPYQAARRARDLALQKIPHSWWKATASVSRLEYPGALITDPSPTDYHFHFGPDDAAYFTRCKGPEAFAALRRRGVHLEHHCWTPLDHALLGEESRRQALEILRTEVRHLVHGPDQRTWT